MWKSQIITCKCGFKPLGCLSCVPKKRGCELKTVEVSKASSQTSLPASYPTCTTSCSVDQEGRCDLLKHVGPLYLTRWVRKMRRNRSLPFPGKIFKAVARVQVDSGTLMWTILIRQKRQEGNLLALLGLMI